MRALNKRNVKQHVIKSKPPRFHRTVLRPRINFQQATTSQQLTISMEARRQWKIVRETRKKLATPSAIVSLEKNPTLTCPRGGNLPGFPSPVSPFLLQLPRKIEFQAAIAPAIIGDLSGRRAACPAPPGGG